MQKYASHCRTIWLYILAVLSLGLSVYAHWMTLSPHEIFLTRCVQSFQNPAFTMIMSLISYIFTVWPAVLLVITAGTLVWWRLGWRTGFMVWIVGPISYLNDALKLAVDRPRPSPDQVQILGTNWLGFNYGSGFPSGHTFFASIFLGFLGYLIFSHLKTPWQKVITVTLAVFLVLAVGLSRIYLGAHWPSDVLGGLILGNLLLMVIIRVYQRIIGD
jgi:undecaprenyl-diphosphatase